MHKLKRLSTATIFLFLSLSAFSQSAKKYFSSAEKFQQANNIKDAIDNYTKAIELDPNFEKAYVARAACYEKTGKKAEAVEDFKKAIVFSPKDKELYNNAGRLFVELARYPEADQMYRKALERDNGYVEVIEAEIKVIHKVKDFKYGLLVTQMALDIKKTAVSYYNHAVMLDSSKNYVEAEKEYKNSKYFDSKFIPAYVGLALVQVKNNKPDDALAICEIALTKDPASLDAFLARSFVYSAKKDYQNALNDITKVVLGKPSAAASRQRAACYVKLGQYQNAVNDFSQAIKADDKDINTYLDRAAANEQIQNYKAAIADYNKVASLAVGNEKVAKLVSESKKKIFELSRESNKPVIAITFPKATDKNVLKIAGDKDELIFRGSVKDGSLLRSITVNGGEADFRRDSIDPDFGLKVLGLTKLSEITIAATDVYDNTEAVTYKIERTEVNKPLVVLETPAASFDNEIFLDNDGVELYLEGKIKDESLIASISIDGVTASFNPANLNPQFTSQVNIANKTKVTFSVKDVNGNETIQDFTLNRSGANAALNNPMGNTWVIFIENSKYQNFASLEGPAKDVTSMKSALANYKFTKVLHKKDMTKTDMEKFFSIELRDYVKNNNIKSLLIWYAGHGKYVSPTGYWVPVDAKTDDEFSYFGINNLKASMQSYSSKLLHTLVITDACESGPTFLLAMRGSDEAQRCENWELTRAKSSQVFTSAGYELASDNSQFTKTFSSSLINNPDACISIDKISKKVISAVTQAGNQAPKFGKIKDLEDEGGTFFFIKK